MEAHLVQQSGIEILPGDVCATVDEHVPAAGGRSGLVQGGFDSCRDEDVGRPTALDDGLVGPPGDHEAWGMERRDLAPTDRYRRRPSGGR